MNVLLTPASYGSIDQKLDRLGVFSKQFTQMVGGEVTTVGMRIGEKPEHVVAFFGDRILRVRDGGFLVHRAEVVSAARWNYEYAVGMPVVAYPLSREDEPLRTWTRTPAWTLGHGAAVVSVEGYAGGIALTHVGPATGGAQ